MKRSEAFFILDKMLDGATPEQAEAIKMAQNDLEFVDLMPKDMVAVTRCKYCEHMKRMGVMCYCEVWGNINGEGLDGFCNYGERKDDK